MENLAGIHRKKRNSTLRTTHEAFLAKIKDSGITPLENFSGSRTKMRFKCYCGADFICWAEHIMSGHVKSCGCYRRRHYAGDISANRWTRVANDAKKRGIIFDITINDAWNLFLRQNKRCALTGRLLNFKEKRSIEPQTASLDRIDSKKGYTIDNIQWVHRDINLAKHTQKQEDFIKMCKEVAEYNEGNK